MQKKGKKGIIITIVIMFLIVVLLAGGVYAYLSTDLFKSNKTLFFNYMAQAIENMEYVEIHQVTAPCWKESVMRKAWLQKQHLETMLSETILTVFILGVTLNAAPLQMTALLLHMRVTPILQLTALRVRLWWKYLFTGRHIILMKAVRKSTHT